MTPSSKSASASARPSLPRPSARQRWIATALHLLIILAVVAGFGALWWVSTLPKRVDEQQTIVIGQTRLAPDSEASVRVVVQDLAAGRPIADAQVKVSLKPDKGKAIPLYEGRTDETGSVPVRFHVPADAPPKAQLVVETRSKTGQDRIEQPVTVEREYRLLLTSDKPLYQPGQTIHMRALALSTADLTSARGATVDFLVEDAKGNKVYRKSVPTSDYGIAAADFVLADMVNQGNYKLSVSIGDTSSERTVEVRPYVLPKFGVNVSTDRTFYLPGQRVEGRVQADYFFGKPVAGGEVQLVGSVWDVGRTVTVDLRGQTDENGSYSFAFDLPDYLAGSGLESGQVQFALEVTVIDQTDHPEQTSQLLPVAAQPLVIEAVAESGVLKPGVENMIYILTAYPDGRPAPTRVEVSVNGGQPTELSTGAYGLVEFTFTPDVGTFHSLDVFAQDEAGLTASRQVSFNVDEGRDLVLLRADRAAYVVGETMHLVALTPVESGSVYLDIVKAGQTLSTRSTQVKDGGAEFMVDVSPDLYGTLELHAYKVLLDGSIVRDTRLVVVDAPNEIDISITADKDIYLPGEAATLDFWTNGASGGVQTALGLAIVDESVYALQRQDPGFAKLYFLLEQELLEPFYQVKGLRLPAAMPPEESEIRASQDKVAKATWADAPVAAVAKPIHSRMVKMDAMRKAQREGFDRLSTASAVALIAIPLLTLTAAAIALWRGRVVKRSLVRGLIAIGAIVLIGGCLAGWLIVTSELWYNLDGEWLLLPPVVALGFGLIGFVVYAWAARDPAAKFLSLLTLGWFALFALLIVVANQGHPPSDGWTIAALASYLLIPGAYLFLGQGRWIQARRFVGGLSTALGAGLALLPVLLFALMMPVATRAFDGIVNNAPPGRFRAMGAGAAEEGMVVEVEKVVEKEVVEVQGDADDARGTSEAPRLRQYFPETLYWAPEVLTDQDGRVSLEIPMADSITTWRLTALASSQDGRLGFTTRGIRVFQDFFVDIDLPVALTQGDEISIPVGVFNYLPEAQEVRLVVEEEPWFELLGEKEFTLTIASNEVDVVYFPIRVKAFGWQGFQVTAWGEKMSDAIRRQVRVLPDGKEFRLSESNWLREPKEVLLDISAQAVPDTARVEVKIYPGVMAQVIEGLEKILRLPHG